MVDEFKSEVRSLRKALPKQTNRNDPGFMI